MDCREEVYKLAANTFSEAGVRDPGSNIYTFMPYGLRPKCV